MTRVEDDLKKTIGTLDLTYFPVNMSRIVETYTRDILNGSLLENEQSEDPVILRDGGQSSGEGLTDGEWENIFTDGKHVHGNSAVSSQTQTSALVLALDVSSAFDMWKKKAEAV